MKKITSKVEELKGLVIRSQDIANMIDPRMEEAF